MAKGHVFDKHGARRVVGATRRAEALRAGPIGEQGIGAIGGIREPQVRGIYKIVIRIDSSAESDSPAKNRWDYTVTQMVKTAEGYDGWTALTDGFTGTAYNYVEDMNDGADVEGNGIDVDGADFPAGFAYKEAPTNLIIPADLIVFLDANGDAKSEAWFHYENPVDGTCAS